MHATLITKHRSYRFVSVEHLTRGRARVGEHLKGGQRLQVSAAYYVQVQIRQVDDSEAVEWGWGSAAENLRCQNPAEGRGVVVQALGHGLGPSVGAGVITRAWPQHWYRHYHTPA